MEEQIIKLYEDINLIGYVYTCYGKNNYVENAKNLMPQVETFVQWFLSENQFGIDNELYLALKKNLLTILEDIVEAVKQNDTVLMMDALEAGLSEYLKMLLPEEYFKEERVKVYDRTAG